MSTSTISLDQLIAWLSRFRDLVTEKQSYLTELDSAIGDADHGSNMVRGMNAVVEKIGAEPATAADALLKSVGMTLVTSVGGASGPLYGTLFLRMGVNAGPVAELDAAALGAALRAGLEGVVARGKAEAGDKTMFDAIAPALDAWDAAVADGADVAAAASVALTAAEKGRDATEPLVARKGRASYLGERSAGHIDPGATSSTLLFQALVDTVSS
ncbi:dihydroxyacetone kinase subunit L [Salinibacterium sp. NSLL150]|uniref:dihydroxyacetone kinase subunit DhaL n=1 Tax=unclassified Salinibacterium TaxID=2632331 RepID=UPI0018CCC412|nr:MULTISPECIES: dihydroxyacetone kinase subunit DhaL [unclassified Salinibacterium]MBH0098316.1 dihydroxyacetone kinase subunit L [Salinibacterium sp. NSLL35]MBH0101071.1 dihydroxyacetone kinase subunit L [Salinibacterium sp. NSLL150]MBH0103830.1 dihydroxyacetone kinase subunit L [Salinibacterium sp. NSLL16]MBH0106591.1 dihydroxyacetone kinase subunit L [Salinibacterium sp. NSLL17]